MDTVPAWLVYVFLWSPLVLAVVGIGIFVWRRGNRDDG